MKHIKKFIEQHNAIVSSFRVTNMKKYDVKTLTQDDVNELVCEIDGRLSPENLHCDGEISFSQAMKKKERLVGALHDLQAMGFVVDSWELEFA